MANKEALRRATALLPVNNPAAGSSAAAIALGGHALLELLQSTCSTSGRTSPTAAGQRGGLVGVHPLGAAWVPPGGAPPLLHGVRSRRCTAAGPAGGLQGPSALPRGFAGSVPTPGATCSFASSAATSSSDSTTTTTTTTSNSNSSAPTPGRSTSPTSTSTSSPPASASSSTSDPAAPPLRLHLPSNPFGPRKRGAPLPKLVLYRGKGMLLFRFLVRAKVFQLMGFLAAAMFASAALSTSNPDPMDLAAVGGLAVGCVVTSYCIWYYSGRYVGELSLLLPERRTLRFSVLDFWGNREDNDVPLERLVAPWRHRSVAEVRSQASQALMPLQVEGDREYYISVPHGHILNKDLLQKILYGAPLDPSPAEQEAVPTQTEPGESTDATAAPAGGEGATAQVDGQQQPKP